MAAYEHEDFWKRKKVLVTGHTGFKGAWMSLWLIKRGAEVTGFSLPPPTSPSLYELAGLSGRMPSIMGDVRHEAALRECFGTFQPEIVFHLAAQSLVRSSYRDPVGTYATNVMGTVQVLEAARRTESVRAIVCVTSDKCYENKQWPWPYRENEPMGGHDPYSSSKGCAELVTSAYRRSFFAQQAKGGRVGIASARAGNSIGGGDWAEDRLLPDCIRALLKNEAITVRNPESVRSWQHVLDPLSGYLCLAKRLWESPSDFSEGWNFGPDPDDSRPVSWLADQVTKIWGKESRWERAGGNAQPHEAHHLTLDCSLAKTRLPWTPRLGLKEALAWTVEWYRRWDEGEPGAALTLEQIGNYERLGAEVE